MRMGVDEAGKDQPAAMVVDLRVTVLFSERVRPANLRNRTVNDQNRARSDVFGRFDPLLERVCAETDQLPEMQL
jgi:hypothetical protein